MKRKVKMLFIVLAACAMSAFGMLVSGCNLVDKVEEKIDQARCEHEWSESKTTKEATCIEVGESTKTCAKCGKVEKEELELVDCVGKKVASVAPTCTEKGKTSSVVCVVCGKVLVAPQELEALGHNAVTDKAVVPTCIDSGLTEGKHCSRCNEVFQAPERIPATGHNLVTVKGYAATCTADGKADSICCNTCGTLFSGGEPLPKLLHTYSDEDMVCEVCASVASTNSIPEVGECVYNKTYRLYAAEQFTGDAEAGDRYGLPPQLQITVTTTTGERLTVYVTVSGESFVLVNNAEQLFDSVWGDGYRDVTFTFGEYTLLTSTASGDVPVTFVIDSTTVISSVWTDIPSDPIYGYVRRVDWKQ